VLLEEGASSMINSSIVTTEFPELLVVKDEKAPALLIRVIYGVYLFENKPR
jgi:hypothetical protein